MTPELVEEIRAELFDPDYADMIHAKRGAYKAGCRGPLCRKFNRDDCRARYKRTNAGITVVGPRNPELDTYLQWVIDIYFRDNPLPKAS